MATIALIDLSGVFRANWHATENEVIGEAFKRTVSAVHSYVGDYDHVGICIDSPPYKRKEIDPNYKAHREKAPDVMHEQHRAIIEQIRDDGHHVFGAQGYEADDIIATLCEWAESNGHTTTIYSADKDMMQLVTARTSVISTATRQKYGPDEVVEKFGVHPEIISDWLALVGDKSDNIPGVKGCGPKKAAAWLQEFGDLGGVLASASELKGQANGVAFSVAVDANKDLIGKSWQLAQLMTDCPIKPEEILEPMKRREKAETKQYDLEAEEMEEPEIMGGAAKTAGPDSSGVQDHSETARGDDCQDGVGVDRAREAPPTTAMVKPAYTPTTWDKSLEPRDPKQAWGVAKMMFESRLFGDFPNPEAILAIVMTGRSFGMDSTSSLRGFHMIKGKVSPSSQLLIGLVKRHPACEWFRLVETTEIKAVWETKRGDEPEPTRMEYRIEDARLAGLANLDQWKKRPKTMLRWRGGVELARVVYPDVVSGLYTVEELRDIA